MSNKSPWEIQGGRFQAPTGPVQMFDPSKFQAGAAYGVPESQTHDFDHGTPQKVAEEVQPPFAKPSWNVPQQQQQQGWYDIPAGIAYPGFGNPEYGWLPNTNNSELVAASEHPLQFQGNFDVGQQGQQDFYYTHGDYVDPSGNFRGEQPVNFVEQQLGDGFGAIQNYPMGPNVGLNYYGGSNLESVGLPVQQKLDSSTKLEPSLPEESNSFAKLPHHPSPFDEIAGFVGDIPEREKSDRLSLPESTSHSRQSSSGDTRFILGSSEHIPDVGGKNASPPLAGKVEHSEDELSADQPVNKPTTDQHVDCRDVASGSTPRDYPDPCPSVGEVLPPPPSLAAGPGTMTGIPAQNQFRKVPKMKAAFIAPGSTNIPPEVTKTGNESGNPAVQCSSSGGSLAEGASGTLSGIDSNQMHIAAASHFLDGSSDPVGDPSLGQSAETRHDHQVNIHAVPLDVHPGSSFVPVGPRSSSGLDVKKGPSSYEASSDHFAIGSADLRNFGHKDTDGRSGGNTGHQEQHRDVLKFGCDNLGFQSNPLFSSHPLQKQKPVPENEVHSDERLVLKDNCEIQSQFHSTLPKLHRDKTMSPATTLWENPDPLAGVGICLVPAAAIKESATGLHTSTEHDKHPLGFGRIQPQLPFAGFDLPQNTGTGPGKNTGVVPTHSGRELESGAKGSGGLAAAIAPDSNPQPMESQAVIGDVNSVEGAQGMASRSAGGAVLQYTVMPVEAEVTPQIVAYVRNESVDSLTDEIAKFGDSSVTTTSRSLEQKTSQTSTKSTGESLSQTTSNTRSSGLNDPHMDERSTSQEMTSSDSMREPRQNQFSRINQLKNPSAGRQESNFTNPDQMSARSRQSQRDESSDVSQEAPQSLDRTGNNQDSRTVNDNISSRSDREALQRNPYSSHDDPRGARHPGDNSRHGNGSGNYRDDQFVRDYPRNTQDRQEQPQSGYEESRSRHDYPSIPHDRPRSRQGYADDPYARPGSRQGYPEDAYGRPRSRQGYPEDAFGRPGSRQGYPSESYDRPSSRPEHDRPQSRPSVPDEYRSHGWQGQGYHGDNRPRSRQGYPEDLYSRPRSRQGYPMDQQDRKGSREVHPSEYYDRPRSRQGYPEVYGDDPQGRAHYYREDGKQRQHGYYERPRSRQEQEVTDGDRRRYSNRYQDDSRLRHGYKDDYDQKVHRGYSHESYERPRSRPQDYEMPNMPYDDLERSYYQSRQGNDRTRSDYGHRSRSDRERERYEEYYRDYYNRYMQYVYQQGGYQQYYPYQYPNRYDKGYLEEMAHYGQISMDDPRYVYDEAGKARSGSHHNSTRGSSPAQDQLSSAADNFARGSRPGSSFSGAGPSPLAVDSGYILDPYNQSYGYPDQTSYHEPARRRMTPMKFIVPHTRASFGPTGQIVRILPNSPADGQPGIVELVDVASLLTGSLEMDELKKFPGPLIRHETHKNDVLLYCHKMALECQSNVHLVDRESAELIWRYLELLIKQNGTAIGTDVADLLLEGHEPMSSVYEKTDLHIACSREDLDVDEDGSSSLGTDRSSINKSTIEVGVDEATDRFRHLLLHGRKRDALEWAMKRNLWGHALFLASKMDTKTHANIMTRFANVSMKMNDPLQTLYQIMSGRQPAAVTLIVDDKWGDWRPHLCIILSNPTQKAELDKKSIITLGDTLASRGLFFAAQFCYMVAQVPFGHYRKKSSKIVLLGASHSSPFEEFATNFAFQCTETFEYGLSLATSSQVLPLFQVYKLVYLLRLIDYGFLEEALKYVEVLAGIIIHNPTVYPPALAKALYSLSYGLRLCDPQRLLMDETEEVAWFQQLQQIVQRIEEGSLLYQSGHGTPLGGLSTGASSEVAEILGHNQAGNGITTYPVSETQGGWPQLEPQQTVVWNPNTQSFDRYVYSDNQWLLIPNPTDPQQSVPGAGGGGISGFVADPVYQAGPASNKDQVDGSTSHEALGSHFPETGTNLKPEHSGIGVASAPESASATSFSSFGSGFHDRQRTTSSSSSHSQPPVSSRRTSFGTVHGPTPPATPGHQTSGPSAPLGAPPLGQKKKQYWPGEEPDENENANSKLSKTEKTMTKNKDGNKSAGWLGGFLSRISRPKEMILPDDKNPKIVWDKEKNRWVNTDEDPNDAGKNAGPAAPPKDFEVTQKLSTPIMPTPSPSELSGNKFSRQKIRGARGQYVDVLGDSSKPSPVAPGSLLNMLPKSASMPPNVFIPNARASEEAEEKVIGQGQQHAAPLEPRSSAAPESQSSAHTLPENMLNPPASQLPQKPPNTASESAAGPTDGTPFMPVMFNPAQFNSGLATPSVPAPSANSHMKYGQRRIYPK